MNISINGKTTSVSGRNIRVSSGKIFVDDQLIEEGLSGEVTVKFEGDLASLDCTVATVNGDVKGDVDANTLTCGDIGGSVDANTVCSKIKK